MPDLLLLNQDGKQTFSLEELAKSKGFRVKSTDDLAIATEWLKCKEFDLMWAYASLPVESQQTLAELLWKDNPIAPFIIFDLDCSHDTGASRNARLFGAQLARGTGALKELEDSLITVRPRGSLQSDAFKVMVVEDLDAPRDIICSFIESVGFTSVVGVGSGIEALRKLNDDPTSVSCILTDIRMPEMNGEELIRQVRLQKNLRHLPIIVLTANGTVDCLVACLKAGASGFLVKPPKRLDLFRELGRACRIASLGASPRLTTPEEAVLLRDALIEKGF